MVSPRGFRMVGANGKLELPVLSKDFQVRDSGDRLVQKDGKHYWRSGVRLGPETSGSGTFVPGLLDALPPVITSNP